MNRFRGKPGELMRFLSDYKSDNAVAHRKGYVVERSESNLKAKDDFFAKLIDAETFLRRIDIKPSKYKNNHLPQASIYATKLHLG